MRIPVVCAARLAHYYATVKFHKLPKLQCRFITASRDTPLATPYLVLTCLLRAFARELHPMWHELGVRHGIDVGSAWFITNSSDFIHVIHKFNSALARVAVPLSETTNATAVCYDFERLYTNIPLTDIQSALDWVIDTVFMS